MNGRVIVLQGDAAHLPLPSGSVDAVVTDPPYALPGGFMGKTWDRYDGREDAGFAYWLTGLIDGEGHFGIKAQRGADTTHVPFFALKLRADERPTLEAIRRELGIGQIQDEPREPNPLCRWVVQTKPDCQRLMDVIDKYGLRAKKRMDYGIWRQAVCEWTNRPRGNRWHGPTDDSHMVDLKHRMEAIRQFTDPPWSGHEFQDWCRLWARECLRVLKPGGYLLAFGGTRTWHRLVCAIEDAGFEVRDSVADLTGYDAPGLMWTYGSGFPKSLDVSKAIDKAAGAQRDVIGDGSPFGRGSMRNRSRVEMGYRPSELNPDGGTAQITVPATDGAARWSGWGTALKPGWEPIAVARKPLAGTVAQNVLAHGTGALNIDGCRIGAGQDYRDKCASVVGLASNRNGDAYGEWTGERADSANDAGRWPPNVLLSEEAAAEMDRQSGASVSRVGRPRSSTKPGDGYGMTHTGAEYGDGGGASRFFPVFRYEAKADASERPRLPDGTAWPTVKPVALMRWLVRLVTPPGGTVGDFFCGTGPTGEAAIIEGFDAILLDKDPKAIALTRVRLAKPVQPVMFDPEPATGFTRTRSVPKPPPVPDGQGDLFDLGEAS